MQRRNKLILLTFSQNDVYINSSGHILHSGLVNCRSQFIGASWQHWMNAGEVLESQLPSFTQQSNTE